MRNNQRKDSISNTQVGRDFEEIAKDFFQREGIKLEKNYKIEVGIGKKKLHAFDLGSENVLVECKSHKWTESKNIPSAKMTIWNEAMYYFYLTSDSFNKYFFCLRDYNKSKGVSLLEYYLDKHINMIPLEVIFIEFAEDSKSFNIFLYSNKEGRFKKTKRFKKK